MSKIYLPVILFIFSTVLGTHYYYKNWKEWGAGHCYPTASLPAAVMFACGLGYQHPKVINKDLQGFLNLERDAFDCSSIGKSAGANAIYAGEYELFYLGFIISVFWKVLGVQWAALAPLWGLFFGLCSVLVYLISSLALPPFLSLFIGFFYATSDLSLGYLVDYRDSSKTFFFLFAMWSSGCVFLASRPLSRKKLWGWALLAGIVMGIGSRFRPDTILAIPFICCFALVPMRFYRSFFIERAIAVGLMLFSLSVFRFGVVFPWKNYVPDHNENLMSINLLHGQMDNQTIELGLKSPTYNIAHGAFDEVVSYLALSYFERNEARWPDIKNISSATTYRKLFLKILLLFPADQIARLIAANIKLSQLAFDVKPWHLLVRHKMIGPITQFRQHILNPLSPAIPALVLLSLVIVGSLNFRLGIFLGCLCVYFFTIPAFRFQMRHVVHVEWIGPFILVTGAVHLFRLLANFKQISPVYLSNLKRVLLILVIISSVILGTVFLTRKIQSRNILAYINSVLIAKKEEHHTIVQPIIPTQESIISFQGIPFIKDGKRNGFRTDYMRVRFQRSNCPDPNGWFETVYDGSSQDPSALRRKVSVEFAPHSFYWDYYYSVHQYENIHYHGIKVPNHLVPCFRSVVRVTPPDRVPFLLNLALNENPSSWQLFQKFSEMN